MCRLKRAAFHISPKRQPDGRSCLRVAAVSVLHSDSDRAYGDLRNLCAKQWSACRRKQKRPECIAAASGEEENLVIERSGWAEYKPFWLPFQSAAVRVGCRARVRAWTGSSGRKDDGEGLTGKGERLVFVTEHGSVYHTTSRCSHLALAVRQVESTSVKDMRNSGGGRYYPCEKCVGSGETYPYLYVTEQGDRYHNSLECSGLKRTVRLEELSSLAGMGCCSRCIQLEGG